MPKTVEPQAAGQVAEGLRLLVVLPALNEQETIAGVIRGIPRPLPGIGRIDVLVIDDGSTDQTAARAREAGAEVIQHHRTRGVGAAFQTALAYAASSTPDIILSMDSDGQFDPRYIPTLLEPVLSGRADFATVSRFKDPALVPEMPWIRRWGNHVLAHLVSRIVGQRYYDVACGMRCYSRRAAMHLNLMGRFTYVQEVFLNLAFKGMRIVEVPIPVLGNRPHGTSRVARNLWQYGWQTLRIIFRCYRDYRPMPFFGGIALALFVPALALEVFALIHYLVTGVAQPAQVGGVYGAGPVPDVAGGRATGPRGRHAQPAPRLPGGTPLRPAHAPAGRTEKTVKAAGGSSPPCRRGLLRSFPTEYHFQSGSAILLLAALALVSYGLLQNGRWVAGGADDAYYLSLAANLLKGRGYTLERRAGTAGHPRVAAGAGGGHEGLVVVRLLEPAASGADDRRRPGLVRRAPPPDDALAGLRHHGRVPGPL